MCDAGIDLLTVGKILGHANYKTTLRYAHLAAETMHLGIQAGEVKLGMNWASDPAE